MPRFALLQVVRVTRDVEAGLRRGAVGTVVDLLDERGAAYEVEVVDGDGRTTFVGPVAAEDLMPVYVVVPGERLGPFRLGTSREDAIAAATGEVEIADERGGEPGTFVIFWDLGLEIHDEQDPGRPGIDTVMASGDLGVDAVLNGVPLIGRPVEDVVDDLDGALRPHPEFHTMFGGDGWSVWAPDGTIRTVKVTRVPDRSLRRWQSRSELDEHLRRSGGRPIEVCATDHPVEWLTVDDGDLQLLIPLASFSLEPAFARTPDGRTLFVGANDRVAGIDRATRERTFDLELETPFYVLVRIEDEQAVVVYETGAAAITRTGAGRWNVQTDLVTGFDVEGDRLVLTQDEGPDITIDLRSGSRT